MVITRKSNTATHRLPTRQTSAANDIDRWVGEQITAARMQAGLSEIDLAARSGIGTSMLAAIEGGTTRPSGSDLVRISQVVGVSLNSLFRGDKHPTTDKQASA